MVKCGNGCGGQMTLSVRKIQHAEPRRHDLAAWSFLLFKTPHRPLKAGVCGKERTGGSAAASLEGSDAHPVQLRRNAAAPSGAATALLKNRFPTGIIGQTSARRIPGLRILTNAGGLAIEAGEPDQVLLGEYRRIIMHRASRPPGRKSCTSWRGGFPGLNDNSPAIRAQLARSSGKAQLPGHRHEPATQTALNCHAVVPGRPRQNNCAIQRRAIPSSSRAYSRPPASRASKPIDLAN